MDIDESKECLEIRCPRLGGTVSFNYCRTTGEENLPCWKVFDCWWESFDVVAYLRAYLSEDEIKRIANTKPKPKITSLVELIEKAKQNVAAEKKDK